MRYDAAGTDHRAEQFVEYYYKTFDSDRTALAPLYGQDSMLTFEAAPLQGVSNIVQKLVVRHHHHNTTNGELGAPKRLTPRATGPPLQTRPAPSLNPRRAAQQQPGRHPGHRQWRAIGGGGEAPDELRADVPVGAEGRQLLRLQRRLPACVPSSVECRYTCK